MSGDCSSIGQSTALSRRKLRVRDPSVPMSSNPIKNYTNLSFYFLLGGLNCRISVPEGSLFLIFRFANCLSHFSSNKYGNFQYFNQYRSRGNRHMWIATIIRSILFSIPRDTILGSGWFWFFQFLPTRE